MYKRGKPVRKVLRTIAAALCLGLILSLGSGLLFSEEPRQDTLVILHTNDEHGSFENFGHIAYKKQQLEEKYRDVFLVSAGDIFGGNPYVDQYRVDGQEYPGRPMVELMNAAGYDVLTAGNHEFDYGQQQLQELMDDAGFPFLLGNVKVASGANIEQPPAYVTMETTGGREVALLGLLQVGPDGIPSAHPGYLKGLSFSDPLQRGEDLIPALEKSDLLVALTHLGYSADRELAGKFPELDLVIGGHSHRVLREPEEVNGVYLTQAGSDTEYLGKIKVTFKEEEVSRISSELIPVEDIEGTMPEVEEKISAFRSEMEEEMEEVIHQFPVFLRGEEALGSLMTEALVEVHNLDFAVQHDGGIRVSSLPRQLRMRQVYELDPFANHIVVRRMTPEEIEDLIYRSFAGDGAIDLRVAGINYQVRVDEYGKVTDIQVTDAEGNSLERDREYSVGMNSYLAESYFNGFPAEREDWLYSHTTAGTLIKYLEEKESSKNYNQVDRTGIEIKRQDRERGEDELARLAEPLTTEGSGKGQVSAGELMAEAAKEAVGADIGTYPSDQFVDGLTLGPGPLYEGVLQVFYDSFRYDNTVVRVELKGRELEKLFLSQARWFEGDYPLQVSGDVRYETVMEGDYPVDVHLYFRGERMGESEVYSVAVNSYKFDYYREEVEIEGYSDSGIREKEALLEYLREWGE